MIRDNISLVKSSLQNWQQSRGEKFSCVVQKKTIPKANNIIQKKKIFPTGFKVAPLLISLTACTNTWVCIKLKIHTIANILTDHEFTF